MPIPTPPNSNEPDKKTLYGRYQKREDQQSKLFLKAAHKSLDIPHDDMQITTTTNTQNGMGLREVVIFAAAGAVGFLGYVLANKTTPPSTPQPSPSVVSPMSGKVQSNEYDLSFGTPKGN